MALFAGSKGPKIRRSFDLDFTIPVGEQDMADLHWAGFVWALIGSVSGPVGRHIFCRGREPRKGKIKITEARRADTNTQKMLTLRLITIKLFEYKL